MSTSSVGAVAARVDDVRSTLGESLAALGQVEEQLEEYAGALAALGEGSTAEDLRDATALAVTAREDLLRVFRMGTDADKSLERFRTRLAGGGGASAAPVARAATPTPVPKPDREVDAAVERARQGDQTPVLPGKTEKQDQRRYVQIDVDHEREVGALHYVGPREEEDGAEVGTWVTKGKAREEGAPPLYVDRAAKREFPPNAGVPLDKLREALAEFRSTGRRPRCVDWQDHA
ncbi:Imm1 family immunity protein [Allokutzneria sp. NRRL B-24872]|uniref:Imm1 family immunity protein n=1 Tax=Allokutzneria sp. NRRL B-24872 TaxID=1137961 RepID=UPI00117862F5|nr:Imm1 family immunity protein [Allokutzneria sp. NRRL B-24872]